MTLHAMGRITMNNVVCEKCGTTMRIDKFDEVIKCADCGATYKLSENDINSGEVSCLYDFVEFQCIHKTYSEECNNACLAPSMYCLEHLKEEDFESARKLVSYAKERFETAEQLLERMEEAKRLWLIQQVSGIDENE